MAHLIDKDALIAMIKHHIMDERHSYFCKCLLSEIDTLEVKDVDLEKEIEKYCRKYYNCNYPEQIQSGKCSEVMPHIVEAARRFFELGLKVKQK